MFFRSQVSVCLLTACLPACIACHSLPALGEESRSPEVQPPEWETRIEAALNSKCEWDFFDAPLIEVCRTMQEKLGVDVALDTKALEDFGINPSTPVTLAISGISTRAFLRLMLNELELTFTMKFGALWITTPEGAEARLTTKVYPVSDLLVRDSALGKPFAEYDGLIGAITSVVSPDTWDDVGGPGAIEGIYETLVVTQTSDIHEQLAEFLNTYRNLIANDKQAGAKEKFLYMLGEDEATRALLNALEQPLTVEFKDESLRDVVEFLAEKLHIPIVIDTRALEDFGIDTSVPISGSFTKSPVRFVLARLLNDIELTYIIRDEVVQITTPECCECQLDIALYPVRDLVEVAAAHPGDLPGANCDFDSLRQVITSTIAPDTWDEVGGPGAVEPLLPVPTLMISQTQQVHEEILGLLTDLRQAKKQSTVVANATDPDAHFVRSYNVNNEIASPDEIATLVMCATDSRTWGGEAGTFVQGLGPLLVVKHNFSVHHRVRALLTSLGLLNVYDGFQCGVGLPSGGFGADGNSKATEAAMPVQPTSPGGCF
ncbi:MAG: hypothetical protein H6821_04290 [Planctomycetaceae bacterium]|nr:hypothetical protein [Planctomycetaceae bacterium]MCB9941191.1 hypothetical protein [Planctomycetaceae bacterium]